MSEWKRGVNGPRTKETVIQDEYFHWMIQLVSDEKFPRKRSWERLFRLLHETDFTYILEMDGNRAEDGTDLRYRFADESGYSDQEVCIYLDNRPCSVLEMMIALAQRCEEHIMDDPESGNRTGQWFFEMITSLGLYSMDDGHFDYLESKKIIMDFLNRDYESDGRGGLFTIPNCSNDLRNVDIWYQMMWYLNDILYGGR